MNFKLIYDNPNEDLLTRLFKVRGIDEHIDTFLDPKFADYWINPYLLNDMDKAVERIISAVKNNEKIMIFGDYDVDGVTSSFCLYRFFVKFLNYKNVSIMYPNRIKEGYGLKNLHIDDMKKKGIQLIITVDNGITSINEAKYAKEQNIDLIITDHHKNLEELPPALAVINPMVSPDYPFKGLAGVGVAFKLICAIVEKSTFIQEKKNHVFNYFLPVVAIGTVADVVPLVHENRVIVKRGLELINKGHKHLPSSLKGFLSYLNLKDNVDTFHIGFIIGPRINAGGRIESPYDSLRTLLHS
jgi:single-stranded-DNA-specific exonuclease